MRKLKSEEVKELRKLGELGSVGSRIYREEISGNPRGEIATPGYYFGVRNDVSGNPQIQKKGGEEKMEKKLVSWLVCLVVSLLVITAGKVFATNWGDSFTVTLTPAGDRGVIIETTTVALGDLVLGTTTIFANDVPVKSTGTISGIEYTMQGGILSGWSLSTTGNPVEDQLVVRALFNSTQPAAGDFGTGTTNLVLTSAEQVGDTTKYEGNQDLDNLGLNAVRNLWLELVLPPTSSTGGTQTVTITITAEAAN